MTGAPPVIELRHLRYFLAVLEERHFGRAAARLHMAQPPLSQAIRRLERELGVELLVRTSRGVVPTDAGTTFAGAARTALAQVELAVAEARRAGGRPVLRVGCVPYIPIVAEHAFLRALRERIPALEADVTHLLAAEQLPRLQRGELDVGVFHDAGDPAGVEIHPLFEGERLLLLLPTRHRLAEREVIGPDDLVDDVHVMWPRYLNPALHDKLLALIAAAGYRFRDTVCVTGGEWRDLVLAVASGRGVAFGISALNPETTTGIVVHRSLDPVLRMPDIVVVWRADPPRQLPTVLSTVRDVAQKLRASP